MERRGFRPVALPQGGPRLLLLADDLTFRVLVALWILKFEPGFKFPEGQRMPAAATGRNRTVQVPDLRLAVR